MQRLAANLGRRRLAAAAAPARRRTGAAAQAALEAPAEQGFAAAAAPAPAPPRPRAPAPTLPPRAPGVPAAGAWSRADAAAVADALKDAARLERQRAAIGGGDVLLAAPPEALRALVAAAGGEPYRADQLRAGVLNGARSLADIRNVPAALKAALSAAGVRTGRSAPHHEVAAPDGTKKLLLQLHDGLVIEAVGIPADEAGSPRLTVCVSSQVGCPMRCAFCATGKGGWGRNLLPHEIVDQVLSVQDAFGGRRATHVVFMGMGEPLLNLPSVLAAHAALTRDLGIGARRVTLSTVGVPGALARLAAARLQSTLAVSIHAPTQELRAQLVPSAKAYPLPALLADCDAYFAATGRRLSFEYTLLAGVNDSPAHARQLALLLKSSLRRGAAHVNAIPWNAVDESGFRRPARAAVAAFVAALERERVPVSVRHSRGLEAAAACGQLRNQFQAAPLPAFSVPA